MTNFAVISLLPLNATVALPGVAAFLGWFVVLALVVSTIGLTAAALISDRNAMIRNRSNLKGGRTVDFGGSRLAPHRA